MEERYIVTIDLGSSKFAITVARQEGVNVQVVYYDETPAGGMSRGSVFNETQTAAALKALKEKAEEALGITITHAAVNLPRYDVRGINNQAMMDLNPDEAITTEDVKALMEIAMKTCEFEDEDKYVVYDAVAQSFSDGEEFQIKENDIVGLERERIEGFFKIFVGRKSGQKRINSVFTKVGITPFFYFPALGTANAVLSKAEMETGVALVEIGAGVTSVTVFTGGILRSFGSFPFGGNIITSDIKQECGNGESLAENIKKGYGICMPEKLVSLSDKKLQIRSTSTGADKQISVKHLSEVITARMEEIIDAALYLIQESNLFDDLRSGIVVTGACAGLANIANFFNEKSGLPTKIGFPVPHYSYASGCEGIHEPGAAASVGLLIEAIASTNLSYAGTKQVQRTYTPAWERVAKAPEPAQTKPVEEIKADIFNQHEEEVEEPEKIDAKTAEKIRKEEERKRKEEDKKRKAEEKAAAKAAKKGSGIFSKIGTLFNEEDEI